MKITSDNVAYRCLIESVTLYGVKFKIHFVTLSDGREVSQHSVRCACGVPKMVVISQKARVI